MMTKEKLFTFTVEKGKMRLDVFLHSKLPEFSRSKISQFIKRGLVEVDGKTVKKPGEKVESGNEIMVRVPYEDELLYPQSRGLISPEVLYEDEHLIAVNKPAGVLVHPAPGSAEETLVHVFSHKMRGFLGNEARRPGVVHRIDRPVSGVVVLALNPFSAERLREAFASREVEKIYYAVVWGKFNRKEFLIKEPLGRMPGRKKTTVIKGGRIALTRVEEVCVLDGFTFCRIRILTGRRHQIRAHMEYSGHPILNDAEYGFKPSMLRKLPEYLAGMAEGYEGIFLHARKISFSHPVTGKEISIIAPFPAPFLKIIEEEKLDESSLV